MKIKVCGLNNQENIAQLKELGLDFMGFIFYQKSKRSVDKGDVSLQFVESIKGVNKVGVFVDSSIEYVISTSEKYHLDYVQLHGDEPPEYCKEVQNRGLKIIKAISVSEILPVQRLKLYDGHVDMFLFDTAGKAKGGNGVRFDWCLLKDYDMNIPFLLAGGIDELDAEEINKLDLKQLYAVDLNSKFESTPGVKVVRKVKEFRYKLQ